MTDYGFNNNNISSVNTENKNINYNLFKVRPEPTARKSTNLAELQLSNT